MGVGYFMWGYKKYPGFSGLFLYLLDKKIIKSVLEAENLHILEIADINTKLHFIIKWLKNLQKEYPLKGLEILEKDTLFNCYMDLVYYKIFEYREKVFQIINEIFNFGINSSDSKLNDKIMDKLKQNNKFDNIKMLLTEFMNLDSIKKILKKRRALSHGKRVREHISYSWLMISGKRNEFFKDLETLGPHLEKVKMNVIASEKIKEVSGIQDKLFEFESKICIEITKII